MHWLVSRWGLSVRPCVFSDFPSWVSLVVGLACVAVVRLVAARLPSPLLDSRVGRFSAFLFSPSFAGRLPRVASSRLLSLGPCCSAPPRAVPSRLPFASDCSCQPVLNVIAQSISLAPSLVSSCLCCCFTSTLCHGSSLSPTDTRQFFSVALSVRGLQSSGLLPCLLSSRIVTLISIAVRMGG